MAIRYHASDTTTSPPPSPSDNKWGPYSGAGDFTANIVIILISLFCAVVLAIALNAVIRHLLCALRHHRNQDHRHLNHDPEKPPDQKLPPLASDSFPTLTFSAGTSKLAGAAADCSICLADFVDGERVRVLPACNHGFHVECVEKWLASRNSCPTCRTSYMQVTSTSDINIEIV